MRAEPEVWPEMWWHSRRTRLTLAVALFAVFTLMAIGPLTAWDLALHRPWGQIITPNRVGFLRDTADRVAGQLVSLPVLVLVALAAVRRSRSWNPLLYVLAAEVGFYVVGMTKIAFSRDSTARGVGADFFMGQFGHIEKFVMSYPSGHSSEAILMYGTVYALLLRYWAPTGRALSLLRWAWGLVATNAVVMSFYLGYHWLTDLVGGLLLGWILLEVVVDVGGRVPQIGLDVLRSTARGRARPPVAGHRSHGSTDLDVRPRRPTGLRSAITA